MARIAMKEVRVMIWHAYRSDNAEEQLNELLTHPRGEVRRVAIGSIMDLKELHDTAPLLETLKDRARRVREAALVACAKYDIDEAFEFVLAELKEPSGMFFVVRIIEALGIFGREEAFEPIIECSLSRRKDDGGLYLAFANQVAEALGYIALGREGIKRETWTYIF